MIRPLLAAALLVPAMAVAKDRDEDFKSPKPSPTTQSCTGGQIWDSQSGSCVSAENGTIDDDTLYGAVREFAHAGQFENAQRALAAMSVQDDDRVLTYWGFTHRKLGDVDKGMGYYKRALAKNPGNIAARSYMGQALVIEGDIVGAYQQLKAIRSHGGAGTWAEASLKSAIETGQTYNY